MSICLITIRLTCAVINVRAPIKTRRTPDRTRAHRYRSDVGRRVMKDPPPPLSVLLSSHLTRTTADSPCLCAARDHHLRADANRRGNPTQTRLRRERLAGSGIIFPHPATPTTPRRTSGTRGANQHGPNTHAHLHDIDCTCDCRRTTSTRHSTEPRTQLHARTTALHHGPQT